MNDKNYNEILGDIINDSTPEDSDNLDWISTDELEELDRILDEDGLGVIDNLFEEINNYVPNPSENINVVEIKQSANGKVYKFYIILVTDYVNREFSTFIKHKDKNTKGYIFPGFENVYNNRYLSEVVADGNFKVINTKEFTDDMYESISEDLEYKLLKRFLQLFTLEKGVVLNGI